MRQPPGEVSDWTHATHNVAVIEGGRCIRHGKVSAHHCSETATNQLAVHRANDGDSCGAHVDEEACHLVDLVTSGSKSQPFSGIRIATSAEVIAGTLKHKRTLIRLLVQCSKGSTEVIAQSRTEGVEM